MNDIAEARYNWMCSPEGKQCQEGSAESEFLRNRLECAFVAGWNARTEGALQIIGLSESDFRRIVREETRAARFPPPGGGPL